MSYGILRILHSEKGFSYIYLMQPNYWEYTEFEALLCITNVLIKNSPNGI